MKIIRKKQSNFDYEERSLRLKHGFTGEKVLRMPIVLLVGQRNSSSFQNKLRLFILHGQLSWRLCTLVFHFTAVLQSGALSIEGNFTLSTPFSRAWLKDSQANGKKS